MAEKAEKKMGMFFANTGFDKKTLGCYTNI